MTSEHTVTSMNVGGLHILQIEAMCSIIAISYKDEHNEHDEPQCIYLSWLRFDLEMPPCSLND